MKRELAINITTGLLLLAGLLTLVLPIAFASARAELLTTTAHALLLLAAAWFLVQASQASRTCFGNFCSALFCGWLVCSQFTQSFHFHINPRFLLVTCVKDFPCRFRFLFVKKARPKCAVLTNYSSGTR
jgi:hypothetical protein